MRGVGARSASLVAVLDDLHRADVSSLRLLAFLARQLHDAAVLVVGTYRGLEVTAADRPARLLLGEIGGQAESLQLTGLTADEVGHLVHKVCGERPPAAHTTAVHERTAGNPFFVQQIARLLAAQGAPWIRASDRRASGGKRRAGRGLARLSHEVVDVAAVAVVVGRRFSIAMVAAIAGLPTEAAVALIDAATRARRRPTTRPTPGSAMTCSARSSTRACRQHGDRRSTSWSPSCWRTTPTRRPLRRRSPITASCVAAW